ncbi:MAG: hypothetical protein Q9191_004446 [Dirinaria sp. TL-2023a]
MAASDPDLESGSRRDNPAPSQSDGTRQAPNTEKSDPSDPSSNDDWTSHLDTDYTVEILEFRRGLSEWQVVPKEEIDDPSVLPESVLIRLFLVEGLAKETITYFSNIHEAFFLYHFRNVLPYERLGFDHNFFFGKWSRRALQNLDQWHIEDRIAKSRPFNLDMITDPQNVGVNHDRYERANGVHRPYSSLEANANIMGDQHLRQAVEECVSTYYTKVQNGLIGVLLFDAPRKVRITQKFYKRLEEDMSAKITTVRESFSNFTPCRRRFRAQLELSENFKALIQSPEQSIRDIVLRFMLDDHLEIMLDFREALDFIDENMFNDDVLRNCLQQWRYLFGQWKRNLANDVSSISYVTQALVYEKKLNHADHCTEGPAMKQIERTNSINHPPMQADFDKLMKEVQSLTERAGSTFQSIMSTMSIVESAKAIAQAEEISKLTNLAFFFIPLTLCASIFGMNITEWEDHLRTWNWVVVSLLVTLLTYIALYSREMRIALSMSPTHLQALNVNSAARNISLSSLFFIYYSKRVLKGTRAMFRFFVSEDGLASLIVLIFIVGWALGIWAIATKPALNYGSRVAAAAGFAVGLPFMAFMWIGISMDDDNPRVAKPAFSLLAILFVCIGVGIWALLRYADLPHGQKVSIAVGMGVGIPCLYTLWVTMILWELLDGLVKPIVANAVVLGALAPSLWLILTKSSLDQDDKVSLSVGLGIGIPCFVPVLVPFL